jgi:tRNA G26 N,N-dimethylase Trm1
MKRLYYKLVNYFHCRKHGHTNEPVYILGNLNVGLRCTKCNHNNILFDPMFSMEIHKEEFWNSVC